MNIIDESLPLVSVVVVTYNSNNFVTATLDSVYKQDYANIELIISDDCSTDNTLEKCNNWITEKKLRFRNVKVIQTPSNRGICCNYNFALNNASGQWIKYIAGDDILYPNCISRFVEEVKKTHRKIYFSAVTPFSNNNGHESCRPVRNNGKDCFKTSNPRDQLKFMINKIYGVVEGPTIFIENKLLTHLGGIDEKYQMLEDIPMAMKFTYNGYPIGYIDEALVKYREYPDSVSQSNSRFGSMVMWAIYDYKKLVALDERDFLTYWHSRIFALIERSKVKGNKWLYFLGIILKYMDPIIIREKLKISR